jgi:hypothetical protein
MTESSDNVIRYFLKTARGKKMREWIVKTYNEWLSSGED